MYVLVCHAPFLQLNRKHCSHNKISDSPVAIFSWEGEWIFQVKCFDHRLRVSGMMRDMISFVEIFVCFFCEKEFGSRKSLRAHQDCCTMKPPDSEKVFLNSVQNLLIF